MKYIHSILELVISIVDLTEKKIQRHISINTFIRVVLSILFLATFWFLFFWGIFNKTESFFLTFDNVEQFYPWYQKLSQSIHDGYIPLWDSNVFGGHSFVGEFQSGAMYLPNILTVGLFGSKTGVDLIYLEILIAIHFLWASIGMYFLSIRLKLSNLASISAGIVFAYLGATAARASAQSAIFFGLTYIPWVILSIHFYIQSCKKRYLLIVGILLSLQIYSGHIQPFFHTLLLAIAWVLYFDGSSILKNKASIFSKLFYMIKSFFYSLGVPTLIALLLTSPQLYLGLQYLNNANRWYGPDYVSPGEKIPYGIFGYINILKPFDFFNILDWKLFPIDDGNLLYLGLVPSFAIFAYIIIAMKVNSPLGKINHSHTIFLGVLAGFSYLISLGHYTFFSAIIYLIPLFDRVRQPGRYVILIHFALSLLIGFSIYYFQNIYIKSNWKLKGKIFLASLFIFLQAVFLKFVLREEKISVTAFSQLVLLSLAVFSFLLIKYKKVFSLTIVGILSLSVLNAHNFAILDIRDNPNYPKKYFEKDEVIDYLENYYGEYRVLNYQDALPKNVGDVYALQTKMGHGASMYKTYFDFISQGWDLDGEVNDLLNIRFIVSKVQIEESDKIKFVLHDQYSNRFLYERTSTYPRVFSKEFAEGGMKLFHIFKPYIILIRK